MCFTPRKIPKHLILEQPQKPSVWTRHWLLIVATSTLFLLGLALADASQAALGSDSEPRPTTGAFNPEHSQSGTLAFKVGQQYRQATHLESEALVEINGLVARMQLTQHFKNTTDQWQEAVYSFPLAETAAVNRMEMHIGERRVVARIRERQQARKIYQQAKAAGKSAALTEQQRPNLFTQNIANIGPGETVSIELHITQPVEYRDGLFHWRLPMTLTPRYIPGAPLRAAAIGEANQENPQAPAAGVAALGLNNTELDFTNFGWALPTQAVPDAPLISPKYHPAATANTNPMRLRIALTAGLPLARIDASYHDINLVKQGPTHHVSTRTAQVPMDRDFELTWQPVAHAQPEAALFSETLYGERYGLLLVLPNDLQPQAAELARDITFIIDTSGSMDGPSIVQAKASLQLALSRLGPQDTFNIIEFNSQFSQLFRTPQAASTYNLGLANAFVSRLSASGGTEMAPALAAALAQPKTEAGLRQVVFITDGSVGNEQQLFSLIHQKLGTTRLFTVGIGAAPNSYFMRKAAQFGRGSFTHIGSTAEVAEKMNALFTKLESAHLTQLAITLPDGVSAEIWPERIPDVYANEPLLLAMKFSGANLEHLALKPVHETQLHIEGITSAGPWSRTLSMANVFAKGQAQQTPETKSPKGIATLWARAKIEALLDEKTRGIAPSEVRDKVLPIALQHELISPYTSLVAVDETPRRAQDQPLASNAVTNLLPRGQQAPSLMYPRTATGAPVWLAAAFMALALSLLLHLLQPSSARARAQAARLLKGGNL
ncbi:marine proteobacterial sortase target protein [Simiduia sp. 21SJ11W-1]|uniref:marine proteobacterial sortase target protein n=1 Tax=Simiduia sp. 21SJ11W-1 TaxID=2909669 RepID=UPI00209F9896|nr:marine proteobacterial sortase target protein [Simiduia sp. 21SJ11W-1]UTA49087.1 marine proteobacterial sortase target protein [Simiduia sp. 21SJ11W-1]